MSIAKVRTIIADNIQYDRATATGDAASKEFQVPHRPVVANSQTVTNAGSAQTEGTHYIFDDALGLATFTTAPASGAAIVITFKHSILSDADIQTFLDLESADVRLASALALETIATNEALIQKKIQLLDIQTDGPAVAEALRAHAKQLRSDAAAGAFDWAEMVTDDFSLRERLEAESLRNQ